MTRSVRCEMLATTCKVRSTILAAIARWQFERSTYTPTRRHCRHFETRSVTNEDEERVQPYHQEAKRQELKRTGTDMDGYVKSLEMTATVSEFTVIDVPRVTQLINKGSYQSIPTTRRRPETEVQTLIACGEHPGFTIRLPDRFGDHGLMAIAVTHIDGAELLVDTSLMSSRALNRQVEEVTLNEIVLLAKDRGCERIIGTYWPTPKNHVVRNLYPRLGFAERELTEEASPYILDVKKYVPNATKIHIAEPVCAVARSA